MMKMKNVRYIIFHKGRCIFCTFSKAVVRYYSFYLYYQIYPCKRHIFTIKISLKKGCFHWNGGDILLISFHFNRQTLQKFWNKN